MLLSKRREPFSSVFSFLGCEADADVNACTQCKATRKHLVIWDVTITESTASSGELNELSPENLELSLAPKKDVKCV